MNCKIQTINLTAGLSVSTGDRKQKVGFSGWISESDSTESCWKEKVGQESHPFVIKTLQMIYLIGEESHKKATYTVSYYLWILFPFFPVGEGTRGS